MSDDDLSEAMARAQWAVALAWGDVVAAGLAERWERWVEMMARADRSLLSAEERRRYEATARAYAANDERLPAPLRAMWRAWRADLGLADTVARRRRGAA